MENIWNGAFSPTLTKSIGTATFIPLYQMTSENWRLLDWEFLNNTAKNDILDRAWEEPVVGFVNFKFVQKGNVRQGYLQPVALSDIDQLDDVMAKPDFRNYSDDQSPKPGTVTFDRALTGVAATAAVIGLSPVLLKITDDIDDRNIKDYITSIVNGEVTGFDELDVLLTWAFSVLHKHDVPWLENWAQEAEQILGEAEDKGLT